VQAQSVLYLYRSNKSLLCGTLAKQENDKNDDMDIEKIQWLSTCSPQDSSSNVNNNDNKRDTAEEESEIHKFEVHSPWPTNPQRQKKI